MAKTEKKTVPLYVESVDNNSASQMVVSNPKSFDDIQSLITNLASGQSVIFKLEGVPGSMAQRMLDFMAGAAYALGGSMQRIEGSMFLVTSTGVGIKVNK